MTAISPASQPLARPATLFLLAASAQSPHEHGVVKAALQLPSGTPNDISPPVQRQLQP